MEKKQRLSAVFNLKAVSDEDGTFSGYGSVFGEIDSYQDVIAPGAFAKSLIDWRGKNRMPPMLWQHWSDQPIGIYTLIEENSQGLYVEGRLLKSDVQQAKEAHALLKAGALSGLSIGYVAKQWEYDKEKGIRTLKEVDLWEISLVTFPANDAARIDSVKGRPETIRQFENFLREAGYSREEATTIAKRGFTTFDSTREAEDGVDLSRLNDSLIHSTNIIKEMTQCQRLKK